MGKKLFKLIAAVAVAFVFCSTLPSMAKAMEKESFNRIQANYIQQKNSRAVSSTIQLSKVKDRQIIIKTKALEELLAKKMGIKLVQSHPVLKSKDLYIIRVPEKLNYSSVLKSIKMLPFILSAEPNYLQERKDIISPNDKFFKDQWYLKTIRVQPIWPLIPPDAKPVVVAVLDTGVDKYHPDLEGQVLEGYDVPRHSHKVSDRDGHGTAVAGTIAAKMNNKEGIVGVNPFAKILPIRIGGEDISDADSIAGIYYAIKQKADIINLSYGGPEHSEAEFDAILSAAEHGIMVVAASGNEYGDPVDYPAAYPTVISVGSTNKKNILSEFSNYGPQLDLVAPGERIKILALKKQYDTEDGTSFSTPIVSGLASLIKSMSPNLSANKIEYLLENGANHLAKSPSIWNSKVGYGLAQAINPLTAKLPNLSNDVSNERKNAKVIALNKAYKNKYDLPLDSDWYKLNVNKKMRIKVELSGVPNMDGVIWMDKYSKGKVILEKVFNKGKLGEKESFTYDVTPGTYYFEILENNNHWSTKEYSFKVKKLDTTPPAVPKVNPFYTKDKTMKGKAEKGALLLLKKGTKTIAKGKASSKAVFKLPVPTQAAGTVLFLTATDAAGNTSKPVKIIVKKQK
ncbi:S8 family serine peptidase [Heyndrickxia sporothermodurans]